MRMMWMMSVWLTGDPPKRTQPCQPPTNTCLIGTRGTWIVANLAQTSRAREFVLQCAKSILLVRSRPAGHCARRQWQTGPKWCMGCAMEFMMQFLVVLCVVIAVLWVREA